MWKYGDNRWNSATVLSARLQSEVSIMGRAIVFLDSLSMVVSRLYLITVDSLCL